MYAICGVGIDSKRVSITNPIATRLEVLQVDKTDLTTPSYPPEKNIAIALYMDMRYAHVHMDMHLYIWKENQENLKLVDEPNALINKLLKIYFEKKRKENASL